MAVGVAYLSVHVLDGWFIFFFFFFHSRVRRIHERYVEIYLGYYTNFFFLSKRE